MHYQHLIDENKTQYNDDDYGHLHNNNEENNYWINNFNLENDSLSSEKEVHFQQDPSGFGSELFETNFLNKISDFFAWLVSWIVQGILNVVFFCIFFIVGTGVVYLLFHLLVYILPYILGSIPFLILFILKAILFILTPLRYLFELFS